MDIAFAEIKPGEWAVANGDHMVGRIQGDHWFGYWAIDLSGHRLERHFDSLDEAAEVLSLEFKLHYGAVAA